MMNRKMPSILKRSEERDTNLSANKSSGVKFTLPKNVEDEEWIDYPSSGFKEIKKRIPPRSFLSKPVKVTPKLGWNDFRNYGDNLFKDEKFGKEYKEAMDILLENNKIESDDKYKKESYSGHGSNVGSKSRRSVSPGITSFLGGNNHTSIANELLKVSEQIKGNIHADIGFGFKSKTTPKQKLPASLIKGEEIQIPVHEVVSEKVDRSIATLQGRIQEQRRKFLEDQSGTIDTPPPPTNSIASRRNKMKAQNSSKLSEIARIYRESIQTGVRDVKDIIRLQESDKSQTKTNNSIIKTPLNSNSTFGKQKPVVGVKTPKSNGGIVDFRGLLEKNGKKKNQDLEQGKTREFIESKSKEIGFKHEKGEKSQHKLVNILSKKFPLISTESLEKKLGESEKKMESVDMIVKNTESRVGEIGSTRRRHITYMKSPKKILPKAEKIEIPKNLGVNLTGFHPPPPTPI